MIFNWFRFLLKFIYLVYMRLSAAVPYFFGATRVVSSLQSYSLVFVRRRKEKLGPNLPNWVTDIEKHAVSHTRTLFARPLLRCLLLRLLLSHTLLSELPRLFRQLRLHSLSRQYSTDDLIFFFFAFWLQCRGNSGVMTSQHCQFAGHNLADKSLDFRSMRMAMASKSSQFVKFSRPLVVVISNFYMSACGCSARFFVAFCSWIFSWKFCVVPKIRLLDGKEWSKPLRNSKFVLLVIR